MARSTRTKLAAAKALARRGFKIFPIAAGAKSPPLVTDFPAKARSEDPDPWWGGAWANSNIGIHCVDLLVLDVDSAKGGNESLVTLELEHELPPTLTSRTPGGGFHLFFSCPGGVGNSVGKLASGIDVRSAGGYVVAPGSEVSGKTYEWVAPRDKIAPAPSWLVDLCRAPRKEELKDYNPPPDVDPDLAVSRARDFLEQAEPAVEGQGGDARTYAIVCKIRDIGVPIGRAVEALADWNDRCQPPWDAGDLERKIRNAYSYAQNPPAVDSVEAMFEVVHDSAASIKNEHASEMYGPDDVKLSAVLSTDYLVKGWLDRGVQAMVFGKWAAGKTFCALHLAAHLAADKGWFGNRVKQAGVLYLGYEGTASMHRRLYALRQEFPDWDLSAFKVCPMRWPLAAKNSEGAKLRGHEALEGYLKEFKALTGAHPGLLVIDPLRNALGGSDSDADLTAPYLNYMQRIIKETGATVMTIHHPGHGDADRARGDSGIEAHMDTVIRVDGDAGTIEAKKQRDDPKATLFYRLKVVTLGTDQDGDDCTTCVLEQVEPNPLDPKLTNMQTEVLEYLRANVEEDGKVTKTTIRQACPALDVRARGAIVSGLEMKQYLVREKNHWVLGEGATELFK